MENLENIKNRAEKELVSAQNSEEIKKVFRKYLGKDGEITRILRSLKDIQEQKRKAVGKSANQIKQEL